jgi:hypothetical protein
LEPACGVAWETLSSRIDSQRITLTTPYLYSFVHQTGQYGKRIMRYWRDLAEFSPAPGRIQDNVSVRNRGSKGTTIKSRYREISWPKTILTC